MSHFQHEKALVSPLAKIGEGTRIWAFANIEGGTTIGQNCNICDGCYVEKGVVIGNHVTLKNGVNVFNGITLEDDVFCGANTAFINDRHPRSHRTNPWVLEKTLVKKGATIGANATILCGITIGQYAFVGAGSVVTKNVPDFALVVGTPARFVGYACCCGKKLNPTYRCDCGKEYTLDGKGLKLRV